MKYTKLGNSELTVSNVCLGTMTWGEQNTEEEAFEQLDYFLEKGGNFIDTAGMVSSRALFCPASAARPPDQPPFPLSLSLSLSLPPPLRVIPCAPKPYHLWHY
jgi:hypothetical protein